MAEWHSAACPRQRPAAAAAAWPGSGARLAHCTASGRPRHRAQDLIDPDGAATAVGGPAAGGGGGWAGADGRGAGERSRQRDRPLVQGVQWGRRSKAAHDRGARQHLPQRLVTRAAAAPLHPADSDTMNQAAGDAGCSAGCSVSPCHGRFPRMDYVLHCELAGLSGQAVSGSVTISWADARRNKQHENGPVPTPKGLLGQPFGSAFGPTYFGAL